MNSGVTLLPRFMGNAGERYFTLQFNCAGTPRAHIVFIPPFAEEMNRCRSLVAMQARAFAEAGFACTLIDFYGTGDSEGHLSDATLSTWLHNIEQTVETLREDADVPFILWGLRLGGLIAMQYAATSNIAVQNIILWQPVTNARLYVTQVLRQRVATLMVRDLPAETTKQIRQRLEEGECVEVAGYSIGGSLIADIEVLELANMGVLGSGRIHWLEHVTEEGKAIGLATEKAVEQLREQGNQVSVHTFNDPPIWLIHERDFAPQLLAATSRLLS